MFTTRARTSHHDPSRSGAAAGRSWIRLRCRATTQERHATMPGDEIVPLPRYRSTRAITILAPPSKVWPWLAQMGQGRGGLYSYDWVENLLGLDMHSADRVDPTLQDLAEGDVVRLVPDGTEPALQFIVARADAPHVLVLGPAGTHDAVLASGLPYPCWTFQLTDLTDGTGSRLVVRFQSDFAPTPLGLLTNKYALAPVHLVMERRMLLGIKQRVEATA